MIVRRFVDATGAEMAADFLRDSGIPVIVQGQHAAEILTKAYPVEVDLLVSAERIEDAREALEAFDHGTPVDPPIQGGGGGDPSGA